MLMPIKNGIDVSENQGSINWARVKEAGVEFAILRTIKRNGKLDEQFYANVAGCKLNKIDFDVYKYTYATTVDDVKKEVNQVIELLDSIGFKGTIWWDVEDKTLSKLQKSKLTELIKTAQKEIENKRYGFGLYCNKNWYDNILDVDKIDCPFWIARYINNEKMELINTINENLKPKLKEKHELFGWQYSQNGKVSGINTAVDLNKILLELEVKNENTEKTTDKIIEVENTVKIGLASIYERNIATGGAAGDQTGKELCIRNWYNKNWDYVLRPNNTTLAEMSAVACEKACANNNIGYDQYQRNTLYTNAKKVNYDLSKIKTKCECDCSSLMHVCALAGGAKIDYGTNGAATINMKTRFTKNGDYTVLTDKKYLTQSKYLKRGDILVKAGSHTVMVLNDGISNKILLESEDKNPYKEPTYTLYKGRLKMDKEYIKWLQWELKEMGYNIDGHGGIDGIFGGYTEKYVYAAQEKLGVEVDGKVGPKTREALKRDKKN